MKRVAPSKSLRPKPRPSAAPSKSLRPPSREDALNQHRLNMAAEYAGEAPERPMRPMPRPDNLMIPQKLKSITRSDQGTTDALESSGSVKKFNNGGCVMAGRGGKYKGSM